jgi:hypothetical protein
MIDLATDTGVFTPIEAPSPTALTPPIKKKIRDMSQTELAAYNRAKTAKSRKKQAEIDDKNRNKWNSVIEVSTKEAKRILRDERGLKNDHVVDTIVELAEQACQINKIPHNAYVYVAGLRAALKAHIERHEQPAIEIADEIVSGEVIYSRDLYALYDAGFWQEPDFTYEQWLALRHDCKTNTYKLGLLLEKDFHECHRVWAEEFLPQFQPTLQPDYDQNAMKTWLAEQSTAVKDFMLLASRNAYKSSWIAVWALSAVLNCPDIRLLFISETNKLSKRFIQGFRYYVEIAGRERTRFQKLFAEICVAPGEGTALSYSCPLARLGLIQATAESSSMESSNVGSRYDIAIFDDPISDQTTGTEEACAKSVSIYSAVKKLREVGGLTVVIGTPWKAEIDLYAVLMKRHKQDPTTAVRLDPAWITKASAKNKPVTALVKDDIESFLFPERLSWEFLQAELRDDSTLDKSFFRSQNLVIHPPLEDAGLRVTFGEDELRAHLRPAAFFTPLILTQRVMVVDTAFSMSKYADFTCGVILDFGEFQKRQICLVRHAFLDHWKQSEIAMQIVEAQRTYQCGQIMIEKNGPWTALSETLGRMAMVRGVPLPHVYWKNPTEAGSTKSKVKRIKGLEPYLENDQLWFAVGSWNDLAIFNQMVRFDGLHQSSGNRHDDFPDAVAMGCEVFMPRFDANPSEDVKKMLRESREKQLMDAQYTAIFGTGQDDQFTPQTPDPDPTPRSNDPRSVFRVPGLRF